MKRFQASETPLLNTIAHQHEEAKLAKDLSCGLPLELDHAKRIVSSLSADPLSLAAASSWIEALQEALDETIVRLAYSERGNDLPWELVDNVVEGSVSRLEKQKMEITNRLRKCSAPAGSDQEHINQPLAEALPRRAVQGATSMQTGEKTKSDTSGFTAWQP